MTTNTGGRVWRFCAADPPPAVVLAAPPPLRMPSALGEIRAIVAVVAGAPLIDRAARALLAELLDRVDWTTGGYVEVDES